VNPLPSIPGVDSHAAAELGRFCVKHRVRSLRVFGSAARGTLASDSDIDLLIEFAPGVDPDLFELGGMQQDLTEILGREVDLKTPEMFTETNLRRVREDSILGYAA
jgi:predicted nucleotidyltransferase